MALNKRVLIVTGPTGVGKTDFVLRLAAQFPAEVLNADIGQMYTPLSIGTAKPDWQNELVPHHLFDILDTPKDFSCVQFRMLVIKMVNQIWAKGKTPIIVGGSTMYIKSLFYAQSQSYSQSQFAQNTVITSHFLDLNLAGAGLWQKLNLIDPVRASELHERDLYRIQRALDIWHETGILPSQCRPNYSPIFPNMQLFIINAPKEVLYDRINARVDQMIQMGWLEEVAGLESDWKCFLKRKKIIGYEVILDYLDQKVPELAVCIELIQKRVRNYAKRQQTFWRGLQRDLLLQADMHKAVFEIDLTLQEVDLYIDRILQAFKTE